MGWTAVEMRASRCVWCEVVGREGAQRKLQEKWQGGRKSRDCRLHGGFLQYATAFFVRECSVKILQLGKLESATIPRVRMGRKELNALADNGHLHSRTGSSSNSSAYSSPPCSPPPSITSPLQSPTSTAPPPSHLNSSTPSRPLILPPLQRQPPPSNNLQNIMPKHNLHIMPRLLPRIEPGDGRFHRILVLLEGKTSEPLQVPGAS
ncbi:hypothetical protein B0T20DRAFT_99261 [Sordaria brevicollis]|uniref:Uncharacterized protein n=1 Tax=Sordaria brevicollis TaxID=83679 RepID=A0AAE0NVV5_SORBR|nr:hypothetical protein B0T20DRAFT_99261 [Sordaria brevicollis]